MPETRGSPDTGDDTGAGPDGESTTGTPRWVKVFGIVAVVVVLLFVVLLLTGGHGPGRHGAVAHTAPAAVSDHGLQRP
jgi:hypothetical protein